MVAGKYYVINGSETRILKLLKKLGLTESEGRVYFTLLLMKGAKAGIVAKNSGVAQSKIYEYLNTLCDKGLASVVENRPKVYYSRPLNQTANRLTDQKFQELMELSGLIQEINGTVDKLQPIIQSNSELRVFKPDYLKKGGSLISHSSCRFNICVCCHWTSILQKFEQWIQVHLFRSRFKFFD